MPTPQELLSRCVDIVKVQYKAHKDELGEPLMELRESLQVLREAFSDLVDEKVRLENRVKDLEGALDIKAELVRNTGVYWQKGDLDPWCPTCWERDKRASHMNKTAVLAGRLCVCPVCNYDVNLDNVSPPKW